MNDSLDDLFNGPQGEQRQSSKPEITNNLHWEPCSKCRGTGMTRWGTCFKCRGTKGKHFKASASERAANRQKAHERRERSAAETWEAWAAANADAAAWIEASRMTFGFAQSMRDAVERFGSLTENQMAAVRRGMDRSAARAQDRASRIDNAPAVSVDLMKEAFDKAAAAGLKRINARIAGFSFTPAKAHGSNPGAIYVKRQGGEYLGKVAGGKFLAVRGVSEADSAKVCEIIQDPKAAARAHGIETGQCSCCGAALTNKASIELGIGPICATKFGW
jgi:hypothetical protein